MRKIIVVALAATVVVGAIAAPATAGKKKKPKAPAAQTVTYYLHGSQPAGEAEISETWLNDAWMKMDGTEPAGSQTRSIFVTNYVRGPNSNCDGNGLLPVWKGELSGTVSGPIKLTLHTMATPGAVIDVRLFSDPTGGCNEAAQPPVAEQIGVAVPAGQAVTEVVFEDVTPFSPVASMAIQFNASLLQTTPGGPLTHPGQVRILYDSTTAPTSLEFLLAGPAKR